jgi:hypothetical protein
MKMWIITGMTLIRIYPQNKQERSEAEEKT